jgi:hypothetical protein
LRNQFIHPQSVHRNVCFFGCGFFRDRNPCGNGFIRFGDFFGGSIEALDGVQHNETAFYVKTSDIPVVFGDEYNKDAATAMGAGTSKGSRFGERTEIIYVDTPVNYAWEWVFHEGIDRHTVNNNFDVAVADRLDLQAQAKTQKFNAQHSKFIAESAGKSVALTGYTADGVLALFNELSKYFINIILSSKKELWNLFIQFTVFPIMKAPREPYLILITKNS